MKTRRQLNRVIVAFIMITTFWCGDNVWGQVHRFYPDSTYMYYPLRKITDYNFAYYNNRARPAVTAFYPQEYIGAEEMTIYGIGIEFIDYIRYHYNVNIFDTIDIEISLYEVKRFPHVELTYRDTFTLIPQLSPDAFLYFPQNYDSAVHNIHEVYFDNPQTIHGDFLVQLKPTNDDHIHLITPGFNPDLSYPALLEDTNCVRGYVGYITGDTMVYYIKFANDGVTYRHSPIRTRSMNKFFGGTPAEDSIFNKTIKTNIGPLCYPILKPYTAPPARPDTIAPCNGIENFRIAYQGGDTVIFLWLRNGSGQYQISYGPAENDIEDNTLEYFSDNNTFLRYTGFSDGLYKASVRGACRHKCIWHGDTIIYTEWSDPIYFRFGADSLGINSIVPLANNVKIIPNPASTRVTIESAEPFNKVEIFDVAGKQVWMLNIEEFKNSITVDVATFEKGTYLTTIYTDRSQVVKKLVVQ